MLLHDGGRMHTVRLFMVLGLWCGFGALAVDAADSLVIYSGRSKSLVAPLFAQYQKTTGTTLQIHYGKTSQMVATLLEEGKRSRADVFFAQDAGALGVLSDRGMLQRLDDSLLAGIDARFRSSHGNWIGISGRARVVAYNTNRLTEKDLPDSIFGFVDPKWKGRIGWPPSNASFQAFVTALRVQAGDDKARAWLQGIQANEPKVYPKNAPAVKAVGDGEIDVAFVNHYYLFRFLKEEGDAFPVRNYYFKRDDPGALINIAGVGVLATSRKQEQAKSFVAFLLSKQAQQYFADQTYEYPLTSGIRTHALLEPMENIGHPDIDLNSLSDLENTLKMLRELKILR